MEPYVIGIIIFAFVALLCYFCLAVSKSSRFDYGKAYRRRKWNKYVKSLNPDDEKEIVNIIKTSSDEEFAVFLNKINTISKHKYNPYTFNKSTVFKRSLYNGINKHTNEFDYNRLKKIESVFPLLKRVYFGPRLNSKVYSKYTLTRKFKYSIKSEQEIPQLDSILDVAELLGISINKILGLCYMQGKDIGGNYIKRKKIYQGMKRNNFDLFDIVFADVQVNASLLIPENYKPEKSKSSKENDQKGTEKTISEEKPTPEPVFTEISSPFYKRKFLIKPDGRKRLIACPVSYLKKYQRIILEQILEKAELPNSCTGFTKKKSIVTNAQPHVNAQTLVKIDLKNFFNSMRFYHVFEVFRGFGYNRPVSGLLACICTDFYGRWGRYVPQGAPSSPMIGNLYALHLDKRLEGLWAKRGFVYTRYADDLTFSTNAQKIAVRGLIHATYQIIKNEKLIPNQNKTKIYRKQHRKSVTGITVNEKINIDRKWINKFRGELHRYAKYGIQFGEIQRWKIFNQLKGKFAFLNMVNPEKAKKYSSYIETISSEFDR